MNEPRRGVQQEAPTARPRAHSQHDDEADELVDLGKVMRGQKQLTEAQEELTRRFDAIEARWRSVEADHATTQSQVLHLQKSVDDLLAQQRLTQRMLARMGKLGPVVLVAIEVVRQLLAQYAQVHH